MQIRNILVPVDFSEHSLHALRVASGLVTDSGVRVHLLHIWQAMVAFTESSPPAVVLAAQQEEARVRLHQMQAQGAQNGSVRRFLGTGAPADEILRFAESHQADLIVMGTYGLTGATPWAIGSVAEAVVRRAHCPVLTCKLPSRSAAGDGARAEGASSRRPDRPTVAPPEEV